MTVTLEMIKKYQGYYHDGGLFLIEKTEDGVVLGIQSCEMEKDDLEDPIPLSKYHCIKGRLYLHGISNITLNDEPSDSFETMKHDSGMLGNLELTDHTFFITIFWDDFPPKPRTHDFTSIRCDVESMHYVHDPNFYDPFE